ncbi:unnamed protein product [Arabis nemorensis]|uniref:Uncharacterized protein n=1 Tax=Arabis nemorensis TaxID=586526 RepID=A0A565BCP1_9BRAS|nr:unnamed protein product [Arabis nemorensis]
MDMASTSKKKSVRRDLLSELREAREPAEERKAEKSSTKEWVKKVFDKSEENPAAVGASAKRR